MPRRTKLQIQEDNAILLRKKENALAKLNTHLDFVSHSSNEDTDKINTFIILFLKCETIYKTLYPAMKKIQEGVVINVRDLKFNVQIFEAALRAFGISYDHDKMNIMFSAKKNISYMPR